MYHRLDDVRLVLQLHDELIYEVRRSDVPRVAGIVKECMEGALQLRVPLEVKIKVGERWGKMEEYTG